MCSERSPSRRILKSLGNHAITNTCFFYVPSCRIVARCARAPKARARRIAIFSKIERNFGRFTPQSLKTRKVGKVSKNLTNGALVNIYPYASAKRERKIVGVLCNTTLKAVFYMVGLQKSHKIDCLFENPPESRTRERLFLRAPPHTIKTMYAGAGGASEKISGVLQKIMKKTPENCSRIENLTLISRLKKRERFENFCVDGGQMQSFSRGRTSRKSQSRHRSENPPESRTRERMFLRAPPHTIKTMYASAGGASEKISGVLQKIMKKTPENCSRIENLTLISRLKKRERFENFCVDGGQMQSFSRGRTSRKSQSRHRSENPPESRTRERMFLRAPPHTRKKMCASAEGASEKIWGFLAKNLEKNS